MDKNKAAYKLKDFGPIYYINIDGQPERRKYMEDQFKYWEIENYTRISAYDGRDDDLSEIIKGCYPNRVNSGEVGCVTSHLKAIKHWYDTSDSDYAVIMEDDCDLSIAQYWSFTWKDFIARVPYSWDVIQLSIIATGNIIVPIHVRFVNDFSTACYIITRHHATKIIKNHINGDKYILDNGIKPRAVADDLIYNCGRTYSCPLFLYRIDMGSSIQDEEHLKIFHHPNHNSILNYWKNDGSQHMTIDRITDFNPYVGTVNAPSDK